jgi:hypothetical protein
MIHFEKQAVQPNDLVRDPNGKIKFAYEVPVGVAAYTCGQPTQLGKRLK